MSYSQDVEYLPARAEVLFRASWDYIPLSVLKLIRYIPMEPWTRIRNLNNLFRQYGKQIIREQGSDVDTEKKVASKDILSILSEPLQPTMRSESSWGLIPLVSSAQSRRTHPRTPRPA